MSRSTTKDVVAAEAEAAERASTAEGGTRRSGRSSMFTVRLNPEELAELQRYAERRDVPASTLVRAWILRELRDENELSRRVERLEEAVFRRTA